MKNPNIILAVLVLSLLYSCTVSPVNAPGILAIKFESQFLSTIDAKTIADTTGRSLTPSEPWHATRFTILGSGPEGATLSLESEGSGTTAKIAPGIWNIVVNAYTASGKETGSGSSILILKPSQTTQATIQILPLIGTGNLSLTLEKNLATPAGSTLSGTLTHLGLPGHPEETISPPVEISILAEQPSLLFENIPSGHYSLVLRLKDDAGTIVGGVAETMLVMKGFATSGVCRFVMGNPELDLATEILPTGPLDTPLMSVSHRVPDCGILFPLAVTSLETADTSALSTWYLNGESLGESSKVMDNQGFLPQGTMAGPISCMPIGISLARLDYVEQGISGRSGSSSALFEVRDGPLPAPVSWRASYDYIAAMGPSLLGATYPKNTGTQAVSSVRAVTASSAGIVIVSGMDKDTAIHAFATGYGAEVRLPDTSIVSLSIDTSWLRLWRDEIYIDGASKSADRLAISADGRFIAAANSASNWIRVYALGSDGGIAGTFSYKAEVGDAEFSDIKALGFSQDGSRLYALSNGRDGVFGFDVSPAGIVRRDKYMFDAAGSVDLGMRDLVVTSSGSIIASAETTSTLYVLDDAASLSLANTIVYQSGQPGALKPSALSRRESGDAFYVIANSAKLIIFSRPDSISNYQVAGELILDANLIGANNIAVGRSPVAGEEMVCLLGGTKLGFILPYANLTGYAKYTLLPDAGNEAGISTGVDLAYLDGAFILAGGSSGIVSVFGRD